VIPTSKTQIDRLGDRLKKGKVEEDDLRLLDTYRRSFAEAYEEVVGAIRETTKLEPTGRPAKSTTSIVEKLRRETIRLSQVQDIAGCRLVVQDVRAQDRVVEQLKEALPKAVVVDRRKQPSHGYRAVHIIATARNEPIEVQVRTELQHLWAQVSEKASDAFDPAIKYGGGKPKTREWLSLISALIDQLESQELEPGEGRYAGQWVELRRESRKILEDTIARLPPAPKAKRGD
jgi:GTP pyrophosphokinase